jgi:hypothetical protein
VTTRPRLLIKWAGEELDALLGALGLELADGPIELVSARIEIERADLLPAGQPRLRVEELPEAGETGRDTARQFNLPLDLGAVGWATVELDRAAREVGGTWESAAHDRLLGAAAWRSPKDHPATVILEPNTEGRLARALARYGEGPIVLYLGVPDPAQAGADLRARLGSGPLGEEWLLPGSNPAGPFMILVAS